jgi:hypothetical protein
MDGNDIIDRNEFFGPLENNEEDGFNDGDDLFGDEEDDDNDVDWDTYLDRLFNEHVKPIIQTISGDVRGSFATRCSDDYGKIQDMWLGSNEFLVLVHRPEAQKEFLSAIESKGKLTLETATLCYLFDDDLEDDIPLDLRNECLEGLG